MKICPKCQKQFPNGFQYCPNDTEALIAKEEFVRQTVPLVQAPVSAVAEATAVSGSAELHDAPTVEIVPVSGRFQEEIPAATQQMPAPPQPIVRPAQTTPRETAIPNPVIRPAVTEVIQPAPAARVAEPQPFATPAQNPGNGSPKHQSPSQPAAFRQEETGGLSFSLPDQGSLFQRLITGLRNIGDAFKGGGPVARSAAGEFQFLLPEEPLINRIAVEVQSAWQDFRRDPKRFVIEFLRGEGSNLFRRNALLAGMEMAVVGYATLYFISAIFGALKKDNGWLINIGFVTFATYLMGCYLTRGFLLYRLINKLSSKIAAPKIALEFFNWVPLVTILLLTIFLSNYNFYCRIFPNKCGLIEDQNQIDELSLLTPLTDISKMDLKLEESAKAKSKSIGGSKPEPKPASGGGGGGRQQPTPPSKGVPPQMALTPQIIMPNPEPPKIKNPSLIVTPTVFGDPKALPPMKGPIGDPTGVPGPPSSGPGTGAGIGRGSGTGVGGGQGGGVGPGRGGNVGGGDMGIGGGGSVEPMTANLKPTILYKEKAKYTEEARQNKVQGTVVLNVIFTADGRITSIRVVRGLPDGLTEKAIEAAQKIRFQPAVKGGQPVSVRGNLEFTFNLY